MTRIGTNFCLLLLTIMSLLASAMAPSAQSAAAQDSVQSALARKIGSIKAINGSVLTLAPDSGADISVTVQPDARILRIAPGVKDLKSATPVQIGDLQVGDRVRVRGQGSADGSSISALEVIVMARSDLEARRQQEQQDWQKRGIGGLVKEVDPAAGTVTISVTGFGGTKNVAIHTSNSTVFRRYAPDSVKFDDAKPSTLQEIRPGDQLRARGNRTADGTELTADEVVTGSFRNVAGTVNSVNENGGTLNVQDLLTKKPVVVKITSESQLHKLPPELAQRIAMRLKGGMHGGAPGAGGAERNGATGGGNGTTAPGARASEGSPTSSVANGQAMPAGGGRRGSGDFQQMLNQMPAVTLNDLHKGDAVLIVATEGAGSSGTAITLLSGVEPILQAAPATQGLMLTPWSLGGAPGGDAQ